MSLAGSSPVPSAKHSEASPNWYGGGLLKPSRDCVCRFDSCRLRQLWTCSSVETERDSAKVEGVRSNRTRSTIFEPVVQLESERSSSKRQAAGSSPAGFTNTGVAQLAEALVLETS